MENEEWNWVQRDQSLKQPYVPAATTIEEQRDEDWLNEMVDDIQVRGTRLLSNIYQSCSFELSEPADFEAKNDQNWMATMEEELHMIQKNKTWQLVDKPQDRKFIGVKWVFRAKQNADGSINKHKARLVVKGFAQVFGVDYSETFASVPRLDTIRFLPAIVAQMGWKVYQLDVKSTFFNGFL